MQSTFDGLLAFAFVAAMLMAGTILRAKVGFLRRALVPASLLGGVLGFGLLSAGLGYGYASEDFGVFTFHCFTLSFMSLVLTGNDDATKGGSVTLGGSWLAVVWVMSLVLQALVGLTVVLAYNGIGVGDDEPLSKFLGLLVTHGFTQGPGQALALGNIWETEFGIAHAINFGLIYASMGFLAAFVIGVPVARWAVRRGLNQNKNARIDDEFLIGLRAATSRVSAGNQVTHSANVDSLAWHISILGVAYLLTDQYLAFANPIASKISMGEGDLGIIFSHNLFFIHGLMICVLVRRLMDRFGLGRFIDNETQRRITGSAVDYMVVATLMSIKVALLASFLVPIVLICTAVTITTALLCFGLGYLTPKLGVERSLVAFGCCCGSTGSGLLLLRILDPDLTTPIARELAFFNIAILALGFHVLTVMAPILPTLSTAVIVGVYAATLLVGGALILLVSKQLARR